MLFYLLMPVLTVATTLDESIFCYFGLPAFRGTPQASTGKTAKMLMLGWEL